MSITMRLSRIGSLLRIKGVLASKQVLYDRIGIRLLGWINQNFEQEGIEKKWTPLRSSTIFARRKGSSKILQNTGRLKQEVSYRATSQQVIVGWPTNSPARYHHFGTHGPYEIRPRNKKALKFFAPPMSAVSGGQKIRTVLQRRATGTPDVAGVSATSARRAGLKLPQGSGGVQSVAFAKVVHHPGLPVRQLLPSITLAKTLVREVIEDALKEAVRGAN